MKKNKNNKIVILLIIGIILIVSLLIFILNYSKDDYSFSILEKKWLNDNKNNVLDVSVYNDVPVYGLNGKGIIFDILNNFTENYEISFNKISYFSTDNENLKNISFKIYNTNEKTSKNDILMYVDNYVLVSNDNTVINNLNNIQNKKIGVFSYDISTVSYYLVQSKNTSYMPYDSIDDMISALKNNEVDFIAVPMNMYFDDILINDFNISYHISEMSRKYVLSIEEKNIRNIFKKFYLQYSDKFLLNDEKKEFIDLFFNYKNINEAEKENYNTKVYNYGYVANMPFENSINNEFVGNLSNYLSGFENLTDIDFKATKYESIDELKKALSSGEVDIAFANYNISDLKIDTIKTISPFDEKYVIISKNNILANSIRSLNNYKIKVVKDTYLYNYLRSNKINTQDYKNTDDLIRNITNDDIIAIDYETYNYYKSKKFDDYYILYDDILNNNYSFIINDLNSNKTFSELFKCYVSMISYKEIQNKYNTNYIIGTKAYGKLLEKLFIIFLIFILLLIIFIRIIKNKKNNKVVKKDEKFKYIDVMTSLKNRNYLNVNIKKWEDNVIYPQAIVIIDLNNLKYINDNYGHEEGDNIIKKAASILIINQKENTDIVRTDGNEFLVYMVGYTEQEVVMYTRKLNKEFQELKYNFGAAIGYSMILDDVKSIDDAINEATLLMREVKEKL